MSSWYHRIVGEPMRSRYHRAMYRLARPHTWYQACFGFWSPETIRWAKRNNVGQIYPGQEW